MSKFSKKIQMKSLHQMMVFVSGRGFTKVPCVKFTNTKILQNGHLSEIGVMVSMTNYARNTTNK